MKLQNEQELKNLRKNNSNLKIGLCHGVFDILHNGHIEHFKKTKQKVDILVVSVTDEKFVNKGPRQPQNSNKERLSVLRSIKNIDYVYLNTSKDSVRVIKALKPDYYFKGKDYLKIDTHGNLKKEVDILKKNKGKIFFTNTKLMSSTKIFNNNYEWTDEQKEILVEANKVGTAKIFKLFDGLLKKEINIIGEPIIDQYIECEILGTTTKDPAISVLSGEKKSFAGGTIAVAKMASIFVKKVNLYTYGNIDLIKKLIAPIKNIKVISLAKNKKIQKKTRFTNSNRGEKLIQISNFKTNSFSKNEIFRIIKKIKIIKDNIIICDFGLGLFEGDLLKTINKLRIKKFTNVQTNSTNYGFNLFTKYNNCFYLSLDSREWSLGLNTNELNLNDIKNNFKKIENKSITMGQKGSVFLNNKNLAKVPVFVKSVKDTTGSGDAYFILTSLLLMEGAATSLIPFLGNLYAGMHGQSLGNKEIISKEKFFQNITSIIKI